MNVLAGSRAAEPSGPDCELGWTSCTRRTEWNAWSTRDAKSAKARSGTLEQGRLFGVDVLARTVFALDTGSGKLRRWTFDGPVGSWA